MTAELGLYFAFLFTMMFDVWPICQTNIWWWCQLVGNKSM